MRCPPVRGVLLAPVVLCAAACSGGDGGGGGSGIRGFVTSTLERDADFGDSFSGAAVFLAQSIPIPDLETPDGDCNEGGGELSGNITFKDVGETVTLVTSSGELVLDPFIAGIYFGYGDASLWQMGGTVTVETPGGDVPAFSRDFTQAGGFTLTAPDPAANLTIDRASDLTLAWSSSGTNDPIFVSIEQYDFDNDETVFSLLCRFDDDGSGTIPSSLLGDMSTDANLNTDLGVSKERLTFLEDVPGIGTLVGDGQVTYSILVDAVQ